MMEKKQIKEGKVHARVRNKEEEKNDKCMWEAMRVYIYGKYWSIFS